MKMALKIWRFDSVSGERALKEYEVDAPDWATLLDLLDIVKDRHDGTLAYRKSCRMMICGSCGMRMDGAAVLACKTRMVDIAESGHVPVISAMGNMPIVKDLVVDMNPFWGKIRSVHAHPARAADHHAAAFPVSERSVVLVLDDVEAVEQRRLFRRIDLELLQLALAGARVEAPDLQTDLHQYFLSIGSYFV